MAVQSIANGTL